MPNALVKRTVWCKYEIIEAKYRLPIAGVKNIHHHDRISTFNIALYDAWDGIRPAAIIALFAQLS